MSEEKELEQFKEQFIKGYINLYLDRLLDLRNALRSAKSFDEVHILMKKEQEFIRAEFGKEEEDATTTK